MGFSFVSWIVMMSIFVLSVRFFSSCIFVVSPLMFICLFIYYCLLLFVYWTSSSMTYHDEERVGQEAL